MYWWPPRPPYYPYYYPWTWATPAPPDPYYLLNTTMQWILVPYYYMLSLEMYKTMIDVWKKTMENMAKILEEKQ